jgi:hypothetical protein
MTLIFRYKTVQRPDKTEVKIPAIPITLLGKNNFEALALIDSGADISVIPESIAELIELPLPDLKTTAYGIGGEVDAKETTIELRITKGHERYQLKIPIKVILGNYDFPILLGRKGFFDGFAITFDQAQEKVSLKRKTRKIQ